MNGDSSESERYPTNLSSLTETYSSAEIPVVVA